MAGEAKTEYFNLSEATFMLGDMADAKVLKPDTHSIGLVKNLKVVATKETTDLHQGVQNALVYSVKTKVETVISMEVLEYTAKNLAYSLGLDAGNYTNHSADLVHTAVVGDGATTNTIIIDAATDISANYPADAWVTISANTTGEKDRVFISQVDSVVYDGTGNTLTITFDDFLPVGFDYAVGDTVVRKDLIAVGDKDPDTFYSAKIVGTLPNGETMTFVCPKVKISEGFDVSFITGDYNNMPFVVKTFEQVPADPLYALHKNDGTLFVL